MNFGGALIGGTWDDLQDDIGRRFDAANGLPPNPDGVSASAQVASAMSDPGMMGDAGLPAGVPDTFFAGDGQHGMAGDEIGPIGTRQGNAVSNASDAMHPAMLATAAATIPAKQLPPNLNPNDPDYGSKGLPPTREQINECNSEDADACILPKFGFGSIDPRIGHNESYDKLNPVAQKGVDEHERSHQQFHQMWFDNSFDDWQKFWAPLQGSAVSRGYDAYNNAADEIPAYKAEADYLENYLNTHPNDPNYSALQQRWLDRWAKIDDYKTGRR